MFLSWHLWFTTTNLSYTFPILETSATALCGTTGIEACARIFIGKTWRLRIWGVFFVVSSSLQAQFQRLLFVRSLQACQASKKALLPEPPTMAPPPPPVPPPPMAQRGGGKQKRVACCRGIVLKQCPRKERIDSKEFHSEDEWLPALFWMTRAFAVPMCLYLFSWASFKACYNVYPISSRRSGFQVNWWQWRWEWKADAGHSRSVDYSRPSRSPAALPWSWIILGYFTHP